MPTLGPITSETLSSDPNAAAQPGADAPAPEAPESGGVVGTEPKDPGAEDVKKARENPPVVPPGIHVPANQYGAKAAARAEAEKEGDKPVPNPGANPPIEEAKEGEE